MTSKIEQDIMMNPRLFNLGAETTDSELDSWMQRCELRVPADLKSFWRKFGGGEIFETESMLSPFGSEELGDDIYSVWRMHVSRGMPAAYLIFHVGVGGLSALRTSDQKYVIINEHDYFETGVFENFEQWYAQLREEYASRYDLR